jgi:hypothetical protein
LDVKISSVAGWMMAEAYAIREGLYLAQHIGCNNFIIQSDNTLVIDIMLDGGFRATSSDTIFHDGSILASRFTTVEFEH